MSKRSKCVSRSRVSALRMESLEQRQLLAGIPEETIKDFPPTSAFTREDYEKMAAAFTEPLEVSKPTEPWRRGRPLR